MEHNDIRHTLSEYIDGAVTAEERAAIETHIASCADCAAALRELRKTVEHLRAAEEIEPPPWLTQKIMAQVREAADGRRSFFRDLQEHFALLRPIRVVIVLFLVVTAYSVYMTVPVREKLAEPPVDISSRKASPDRAQQGKQEQQAPQQKRALRRKQDLPQKPAYRSLDMKYSYERPAPPEPAATAEREALRSLAAPEQAPVVEESVGSGGNAGVQRPAAPAPAAPLLMQDKKEGGSAMPPAGMIASAPAKRAGSREVRPASEDDLRPVEREETADERTERDRLIEHFLANDLPEDRQGRRPVVSARPVLPASPELRGLEEPVRTTVQRCRRAYLVEWKLSERTHRYYYCFGPEIVLLGRYEFTGGQWIVAE